MAVRLGARGTRFEYVLLLGVAYLSPLVMWLASVTTPWTLVAWISLPLVVQPVRLVLREEGRDLNRALAGTARLELAYGLTFSFGLLLAHFF